MQNVVPLQRQSEDGRALIMRDIKAVSGGPMQIVAKYLIPCKNTFKHYGKDFV